MDVSDLLITKFAVPLPRARLLPRAHLIEQLSQSHTLPLILLAEQGFREAADEAGVGAVLATRAVFTTFQGRFAEACALAHQALSFLPEQEQRWRGHAWACWV